MYLKVINYTYWLRTWNYNCSLNDEHFEVTTYRIDGEYSDGRRPDKAEFTDDITKI